MDILSWLWLLFIVWTMIPIFEQRRLALVRLRLIREIERQRGSRVITMIHRQEGLSFLGIPLTRYINIEDSEEILRAIRFTPDDMPIDLLLHTPGGLVLAAEQIARAIQKHPARVTVFVPHYAMSGGTLVALAADQIVMDPDAVLGPVDPQLGGPQMGYVPAASVLKALETPNPNRDDQTLILGDIARKALQQVHQTVYQLLLEHHTPAQADEIARALSDGRWTHDYPINFDEARQLGLRVSDEMPREIYELMELYPQTRQRRPGVEFIPAPYRPPAPSPGKGD